MSAILEDPSSVVQANSTSASSSGSSSGRFGRPTTRPTTWSTGAKNGVGTAFYTPLSGESKSNVWFTLTEGVMSEVYYPTLSRANLQSLSFAVTDGVSFVDFEPEDTCHKTQLFARDALIFKQTNTAKNGKYRIEKIYVTDPSHHTVFMNVSFYALTGCVNDYRLYLYVNPAVSNDASDDVGRVVVRADRTYLTARDDSAALAVSASVPFVKASTGDVTSSTMFDDFFNARTPCSDSACAGPGDIALVGQMDIGQNPTAKVVRFTVAIGFGMSESEAIQAVDATVCNSFTTVAAEYRRGWRTYLAGLDAPTVGSRNQYFAALMTIKAHEDKLHPGAIVASLSIPWGDNIVANHANVGGYHLVWARDLYQVASALAVIGDVATAKRALTYLDDVQQQADGRMPQNSWVDGTAYWTQLQLDEVAYPILLAGQLEEFDRYHSLVRPAADVILEHGPMTPQERWEENSGFSPSTLAAEIAALVVAASFARRHRDYERAALYLATADRWAQCVDEWTTATGWLSGDPYYIRVNDTTDASDGHYVEIKNGGGWHPKSSIVDAGFLELVRLGIKSADDPLITHSLNIIDRLLKYDTGAGPAWYRYNHDGYGEKFDGSPYNGTGIGRPWPVLTGERGEYEMALSISPKRTEPVNVFGAENLLQAMARFANEGRMIPEQVWDKPPVLDRHLQPGRGTGSATPLVWAMAQYLRLCKCIESGRIVEMPVEVRERYQGPSGQAPSARLPLKVESARPSEPATQRSIYITGETLPYRTVIVCRGTKLLASTTADGKGRFTAVVKAPSPGLHTVTVAAYDNAQSVTTENVTYRYEPQVLVEAKNVGHPLRTVEYPYNEVFKPGDFELRRVRMSADDEFLYFEIELGHLDNPWNAPSGISKQLIDIYIDTDGVPGSGQRETLGLNARFSPDLAWERLIRVTGNWGGESHVYDKDWGNAGPIDILPNYSTNTVTVVVPVHQLGGPPTPGWGIMVLVAGEHQGDIRPVQSRADEWHFGRITPGHGDCQYVDLLVPNEWAKQDVFILPPCQELPMIRI